MVRRVAFKLALLAALATLALAGSADAILARSRSETAVAANDTGRSSWDPRSLNPFGGAASSTSSDKSGRQTRAELVEENDWKNDLVLWLLPQNVQQAMPRVVKTWFRCWVLCMALYFGVGSTWAYYAYFAFGAQLFKPDDIPIGRDIWEQMKVSFKGMPLYAMLPTLTEFCVEQGWTMAYSRVADVGVPRYVLYFALYMVSVEFFVYWQHRILHMGVGYKWLHNIHHKYNKGDQMSPFAGLAFHPLDGIMQALPYSWTLFYVPMHFLTHEMLLFFTSIWTTNIHDNLHAKIAPVMGAGYHTIHHTLFNYNYGHYFTFVDRLFGTLISPEELADKRQADRAAAEAKAR